MKFKRFFKSLSSKISPADIFMMIISAIVGVLFSLYPDNVPQELWWIKILVLAIYLVIVFSFLALVIWLENKRDRFNYVHMIEKAHKNGQWKEVYTLGYPLLRPLWTLSKLSLRIHVARLVQEAVEQISENSINDMPFNKLKIQAEILIDVLGYSNYVLGNKIEASNNIKSGIDIITEAYKCSCITQEEKLIMLLRAWRHLLAIGNASLTDKEKIVEHIRDNIIEANGLDAQNNELAQAIYSAEYAVQKFGFKNGQDAIEIIQNLEDLKENFKKINNVEWMQKCDQLVWEIKLKTEGYNDNIKNQIRTLINSKTIVSNRFLKVVNLYLDYQIKRVYLFSFAEKRSAISLMDDIQNEIKKIVEVADNFASQSEDVSSVNLYQNKKAKLRGLIRSKNKLINKNLIVDNFSIVLLDFDYTLFDYKKAQIYALKKTCKDLGLKCTKQILSSYDKISDQKWTEHSHKLDYALIRKERISEFLKTWNYECDEIKFNELMEGYMANMIFMPGARKFITTFSAKSIIIITDASKGHRIKAIQHSKLKDYVLFSAEDAGCLKTDPNYFDEVLKRYYPQADRESVLVIGDGINSDIEGANNSGLTSCLVTYGFEYRTGGEYTGAIKPKFNVKTLNDLCHLKVNK